MLAQNTTPRPLSLCCLALAAACSACSSSPAPADGAAVAERAPADLLAEAVPDAALDAAPDAATVIAASEYCERVAASYCRFYLRCGRIVAASQAACESDFVASCNARYEPLYAALAAAGLLELSSTGLAACSAHLDAVPCEQQIRDLDGACAGMWRGLQPAGKPCGLDVESLVCAPGSACALTLELCGSCRPVAGVGQACGGETGAICGALAECTDGKCRARALPGESCGATVRCVIGARCDGVCRAPELVGESASCDATHRCQHKLSCVAGKCVANAASGTPCDDGTPCETGRCASELPRVCSARLPEDASCSKPSDCLSASCIAGHCDAIPGHCFAP